MNEPANNLTREELYQGPWKLIFLASGKRELDNLQTDLSETKNVAEANPDLVERLTALMRRYIAEGRSTVGAAQKNDVEMSVEKSAAAKKIRARNQRRNPQKQWLSP
jgi:hypothetical protein